MSMKLVLESSNGNVKIVVLDEKELEFDIHTPSSLVPDPKVYITQFGVQKESYTIYGGIKVLDDRGNVIYEATKEELRALRIK